MKLYCTVNSPYARRIRLAVREAGLRDRVEEADIHPLVDNVDQVLAHGPGGKVPLLLTDAGTPIAESRAIAHYLHDLSGGKLYPSDPTALEQTLEIEGIASVLLDSTFGRNRENRREPALRSAAFMDTENRRVARCYDALEERIGNLGERFDMGAISVLTALAYADYRMPGDAWRDTHPKLAAWFEGLQSRPSVAETAIVP